MSFQKKRKIRVGILFGGRSGEHEVSLTSARGIMDAIEKDKYEVVPIGITKSGHWLTGREIHQHLLEAAAGHPIIAEHIAAAEQSSLENTLTLPIEETGPLDVIFPVLHGTYGEDGTVQGFLELLGLPYVGAGVAASAVGMDKAICKDIFRSHNLSIVPHLTFLRRQWEKDPESIVRHCEKVLTYPMFVKPANLGSSVGVHKAKDRAGLQAGLADAVQYDRKIIIEQGVDARELEVSVLGNDEPIASIPGEILPSREFYSYAAKYLDNSSELLIPAPLEPDQVQTLQEMAVRAFQALDCSGMARCDFLMDRQSGEIFINELNTIPGFTPISMYPKLWEASGLSYSQLIDRLIELALERYEDKRQSKTTFDVGSAE